MLYLAIDNTDHHNYLGNLLRAVTWDTVAAPLPDDLAQLILDIDPATIEDDLSLMLKLASS